MAEDLRTAQQRLDDRNNDRVFYWYIYRNGIEESDFEMRGLLPEQYTCEEPGRVNVQQTRGGGWIDNFGLGFGSITMSGTTGFRLGANANKGSNADKRDQVVGYDRWVQLREFFRHFFTLATRNPHLQITMEFHNYEQQDHYVVYPQGLPKLFRSVNQPLLFRYELAMTILGLSRKQVHGRSNEYDPFANLDAIPDRASLIADRLDTQLNTLWDVYVQQVLMSGTLPENIPEDTDAATQVFVDQVLQQSSAAGWKNPTTNQDGVFKRTRTLAQKITDYANGSTEFVSTTLAEVRDLTARWREVLDAVEYAVSLPAALARETKETLCAVQSLLLYPHIFRSTLSGTLTDLTSLLADSGCATTLRV